jgi:hypothetical protein
MVGRLQPHPRHLEDATGGGVRQSFLASARTAMARIGRDSLASSRDPKAHAWQPTTGSGYDLRIGKNKRSPIGFPPFYLLARPSLSALFLGHPIVQPMPISPVTSVGHDRAGDALD